MHKNHYCKLQNCTGIKITNNSYELMIIGYNEKVISESLAGIEPAQSKTLMV